MSTLRPTSPLLGTVLCAVALGLAEDAWHGVARLTAAVRRPAAVYRRHFLGGLAVSLRELARVADRYDRLPGMVIRGALVDRSAGDWILVADADGKRPGIPLDAVRLAVRARRRELEPPGIDIRPSGEDPVAPHVVTYFGGVGGSVVGGWFFRFDYWMKQAALAAEPTLIPEIPVYWDRAVAQLERDIASCAAAGARGFERHSRYWLCAGNVKIIERPNTMALEGDPLRVLAERRDAGGDPTSPCASRGTDDPLAAEFADAVTEHLAALSAVLPVREIEDFTRLLAAITWLDENDPGRGLQPWLSGAVRPTATPATAPGLVRRAERTHTLARGGERVLHAHAITVSGGVVVQPDFDRRRETGRGLVSLRHAVLAARPASESAIWSFRYRPAEGG
jgi:hypothetical protein